MSKPSTDRITISSDDFEQARARVSAHAYHTPLLTSRLLGERTGFEVRLKAEMFQRGGSYKIRGPLNKLPQLSEEQKRRGVICSSAGNHAQGVALAAGIYGVRAVVVVMAGKRDAVEDRRHTRIRRGSGAAWLDLG